MMKRYLTLGALGLSGSLILVACGQRVTNTSVGDIVPGFNVPGPSLAIPGRTVRLTVVPRVASRSYKTQSAVAYVRADINHLTIEILRVNVDETTTLEASVDLLNTQLDSPVTFSSLAASAVYRVKLTAYATEDFTRPISDDFLSTTDVNVGNDEAVSVSLTVKLLDSDFAGSGSGSIDIIDGTYSNPDAASISVATPTPAPQLAVSFTTAGMLSTAVTLVSITGADTANNYVLSLDRRWVPEFGVDKYYLGWGTAGNMQEIELGAAWPPPETTIAGPSGAGSLTVQFQGAPPAGGFPLNETVAVTVQ